MLVPGGRLLRPGAVTLLALSLCWSALGRAEDATGCTPVARIVSLQGTLQLQRAGQGGASYVRKLGTHLCANDLLHTDRGSRAALFISAEMLVRLLPAQADSGRSGRSRSADKCFT